MADITSPQAILFSNERIRGAADALGSLYYTAVRILAEWNSYGGTSLIPNNVGDTLIDGSATDGRPIIDGAKVNNIINRLSEFKTDMEDNSSAKLTTVLQVSVNAR